MVFRAATFELQLRKYFSNTLTEIHTQRLFGLQKSQNHN